MSEEPEEVEDNKRVFDIMPMVRIYIAASTITGDQLEVDELKGWISQAGVKETVLKLLDDGLVNVYLTCFDACDRLY